MQNNTLCLLVGAMPKKGNAMTDAQALNRAAELLDKHAERIKVAHSDGDDMWRNTTQCERYYDARLLAQRLREIATKGET